MTQTDEIPDWIIEGMETLGSDMDKDKITMYHFAQAIRDGRVTPPEPLVEKHLSKHSNRYTKLEGMSIGMVANMVLDVVPSWTETLESVGIDTSPNEDTFKHTEESIIKDIQRLTDDGTPPTLDEILNDDHAPDSAKVIAMTFGSCKAAFEAAGFDAAANINAD